MKKNNDLSLAMSQSITDECIELVAPITEVALDSVLEDGLFKDIPIISSAISIYKIGNSLWERHWIRKLYQFITTFNSGILDERQREKYIKDFRENQNCRDTQISYLLVVLDKYINLDKPEKLAKIYLAYLNSVINWTDVMKYSEVIDRLLPGDIELLKVGIRKNVKYQDVDDGILRLVALGLMVSFPNKTEYDSKNQELKIPDGDVYNYKLTNFGEIFLEILNER